MYITFLTIVIIIAIILADDSRENFGADDVGAEPETSPQNLDSQARSRKDSTTSKLSSGSGAPGEREIVAALSEHAQKIAEQVLSRPETGQDLLQDAQVRRYRVALSS